MESKYHNLLLVVLLTALTLTKQASCTRFSVHIPTRHSAPALSTTSLFGRFKNPESNIPQKVEEAECSTSMAHVLKRRLGGSKALEHPLSKFKTMQKNARVENNKATGAKAYDDQKIVHGDL